MCACQRSPYFYREYILNTEWVTVIASGVSYDRGLCWNFEDEKKSVATSGVVQEIYLELPDGAFTESVC